MSGSGLSERLGEQPAGRRAGGQLLDRARDFSIPRLVAPGFTVVNVAADYKVNEYAKVFARIDNLFDERYEDPTGFLRPGLAVYGGVRLTN